MYTWIKVRTTRGCLEGLYGHNARHSMNLGQGKTIFGQGKTIFDGLGSRFGLVQITGSFCSVRC
jgi:hypothetical protein